MRSKFTFDLKCNICSCQIHPDIVMMYIILLVKVLLILILLVFANCVFFIFDCDVDCKIIVRINT